MDIVLQKCKFEYYHELQPPSTFVSNQTHILLVNVAVPWHIYCTSKFLPHRNRGERYAMVAKASLCGCSIVTAMHVVPPQITESSEERFILNMSYPLNAAVMYNFKHELGNLNAEFDYYKSMTKKKLSTPPRLNAISMSDEAHILYTNTKKPVGLERVIAMIQSSELSFLTQEDRLIEESKFEKWFTACKIASGLTFLFSLMGIVSAIVMFCYCCRQNTIKSLLVAAVAKADQVLKASASDIGYNITKDMTYHLYVMSAFIISFLMYKLYKWIYKNYISLQILTPIGDSDEAIAIYTLSLPHLKVRLYFTCPQFGHLLST